MKGRQGEGESYGREKAETVKSKEKGKVGKEKGREWEVREKKVREEKR